MSKNTTQQGVLAEAPDTAAPQLSLFETDDDAAAAFLDRWTEDDQDKKPAPDKPEVKSEESEPEQVEEEQTEAEEVDEEAEEVEDPEDSQDEDTENTEEEAEEEDEGDEPEAKVLDDEAVVEVKVDDETLKVSVKDLKRLYGQEAALTKKSQQNAQKRKELDAEATKVSAVLERMYKKAAEKWEPYSKVDMLVAAKTLDNEEFTALRTAAQTAYEEFQWITQEVDNHVKDIQTKQQEQLKAAAVEAVKVLKETIPGWNQELYGKILSYGVAQGLDETVVNNLVDPVALTLIHKARLYDEGQKVVTKKKVLKPAAKKVLKPNANPTEKFTSEKKVKIAQRFKQTGDVDDAAELFLSRWEE